MMGVFCVFLDKCTPRQFRSVPLFRLLDAHYKELQRCLRIAILKSNMDSGHSLTDETVEKYLGHQSDI